MELSLVTHSKNELDTQADPNQTPVAIRVAIYQKICKMTRMRAWQILLVGIIALVAIAFLPAYRAF